MHFIEHNFLAGRTFADLEDLNRQAVAFCEKVNAASKRHLHASPRELLALERTRLHPLPLFVPDVYLLHQRIVDVEGYVRVEAHRYSVPYQLIGRRLEVRETKDRLDMYDGPRVVATHARARTRTPQRIALAEHRPPRGEGPYARKPSSEEQELQRTEPPLPAYATALQHRSASRGTMPLRRLLALRRDYPRAPFLEAVTIALQYGLFDLDRLERLMLRLIGKEYFVLTDDGPEDPHD
jgi:hypothetical protein